MGFKTLLQLMRKPSLLCPFCSRHYNGAKGASPCSKEHTFYCYLWFGFLVLWFVFCFVFVLPETVSYICQASYHLPVEPRTCMLELLTFLPLYHTITKMHHHAWVMPCWEQHPQLLAYWASTLPVEPHPQPTGGIFFHHIVSNWAECIHHTFHFQWY